jgi:outer membrane receptor protein involved in Fe transport
LPAVGLFVTLAGGLAGASTARLHAQEPEAEPPVRVQPLDELVVTATRTETRVRDVPVNVTVVTRDQILRSPANNLQDLLQEIPGFGLGRESRGASAHPSWQPVGLRGLVGSGTSRALVLVDGVPLNDPFFGWVRWSHVPLEMIERVEVVRGGGSMMWGSGALGGVINIITRRPSETALSLGLQGGSLQTIQADGVGAIRTGRMGVLLSGEYFDSDGYIMTREDQRGEVDVPNASQTLTFNGKVEFEASPAVRLHVQGGYLDQEKLHTTELQPNTTEVGFGRVGATLDAPDGSRFSAHAFTHLQTYANGLSSVDETRSSERLTVDQFDVPSTAIGAGLQWERAFGRHRLSAGVDYLWVEGEAWEDLVFRDGVAMQRRHAGGEQILGGLYVQDEFHPAERWQLVGGVRVDRWRNYAGFRQIEELASGNLRADETFADRTEWYVRHNLGLRIHQTDRLSWRGGFYSGLRVPNGNELYKPFRRTGGVVVEANAALDPESMLGAEIGVDYQVGVTLLARLTGFWAEIRDAILEATIATVEEAQTVEPCGFVPAGGACQQRANIGTVRSPGLEAELELRPSPAWRLSASYTYNPTEITEAPGREELVGNRAIRTAVHQGVLRIGYSDPDLLDVSVIGRYLGPRFEEDTNLARIDDSLILDLRVARQLTRTVGAFATVENLFDTEYEISRARTGYVRVGAPLTVSGGLRVRVAP